MLLNLWRSKMFKFKNKKTNEVKSAYAFREDEERIYIKFSADGKEYGYFKDNIEIIDCECGILPFKVYTLTKECYKCHQSTKILTYITFADNPKKDVCYPWNKRRLLEQQDIFAHLQDPSIEYYGLNVIGDIEEFDLMLMEKYPDKIHNKYSQTKKRIYPMNVCEHCGNGQGWYYIYRDVNEKIKAMNEIDTYTE